MHIRLLVGVLIVVLLVAGPALAQDDDKPTIAFLRYRASGTEDIAKPGIWDVLQAHELISPFERELLDENLDLDGERINVSWLDAASDVTNINAMVEKTLDRGADILLTFSTPVTQITANITKEMDDPPVLLFAIVSAPYSAGIADSPCIKMPHVSGTHLSVPYEQYVALSKVQLPDIQTIGTIVDPAQTQSVYGVSQITRFAEALGLTVEVASIASAADLPQATASLADKGVEMLMIGAGYTESRGIPAVLGVARDYGIPVFGVSPRMIYHGALVGAGFDDFYGEGVTVGRMIAAYIDGTLDTSTTGISSRVDLGVAVNLDTAEEFGITVADSILDEAVMVIEDGELNVLSEPPSLPEMSLEERKADDAAFLATLECTPERIAEEQAQLDMQSSN
ncbi:MAG: ABC transporter substrate binding protein [Chloroflexi bacterium]|nr:ABC transporter substrate binding protein [Chloroflexota bacterium]